jgi:hypothetical protein
MPEGEGLGANAVVSIEQLQAQKQEVAPVTPPVEAQSIMDTPPPEALPIDPLVIPENKDLETGDWYWDKENGVKGTGERPEWLLDKYDDVKNQSKSYPDLQKQFGGFTGAPKDGYELNVPKEIADSGIVIESDDPLVEEYMEFAKSINMSQEAFDGGLKLIGMSKIADGQMLEEVKSAEFEKLGANGQAIIDNIKGWGEANLTPEENAGLLQAFPTAEALQVGAKIIAMTRPNATIPIHVDPVAPMTEADVQAMQFAVDEHGERKINDPAYRKEYEEASKRVRGTGDHIEFVGQ